MHKERAMANVVESVTVIGDVKGKTCIIIDDMTDTAGTLCKAATELKDKGATKVYAFITHGIFSGPAAERIAKSDLEAVVCTDTM
jgi:ribose-phosphate pyrophosphokinase